MNARNLLLFCLTLVFTGCASQENVSEETINLFTAEEVYEHLKSIGAFVYGEFGEKNVQVGLTTGNNVLHDAVMAGLKKHKIFPGVRYSKGIRTIEVPVKSFFTTQRILLELRKDNPDLWVWEGKKQGNGD